jgi:hypothetical protein
MLVFQTISPRLTSHIPESKILLRKASFGTTLETGQYYEGTEMTFGK